MNFRQYQDKTDLTAVYPNIYVESEIGETYINQKTGKITKLIPANYIYPALGLAGETGETIEQVKKALRDDHGVITEERRENTKKELGDLEWYTARLSKETGNDLQDIAKTNVKKLLDRKSRGVIHGHGDDR